jgi:hypothetical protein
VVATFRTARCAPAEASPCTRGVHARVVTTRIDQMTKTELPDPAHAVLTEETADMPLVAAMQRCASDLIATGAGTVQVFEAMLSVALAGKVAVEPPMDVARQIYVLAMGILGKAALEEIDNNAVRH